MAASNAMAYHPPGGNAYGPVSDDAGSKPLQYIGPLPAPKGTPETEEERALDRKRRGTVRIPRFEEGE